MKKWLRLILSLAVFAVVWWLGGALAAQQAQPPAVKADGRVSLAVSEFGQPGVRRRDPHTARTEIHHQGGVNIDPDDLAEAVRIVGNLIPHRVLLSRRWGGWRAEGTRRQIAPGRGAGRLHPFQYAATCHRLRRAGP